jgi:hypothetical protein
MNEYFGMFLEEFGGPFNRREVPISSLERYRHRLPSNCSDIGKSMDGRAMRGGYFGLSILRSMRG